MDSSSTSKKEKKGLGRLWTKVKLAIRFKSKSKSKSTTTNPEVPPDTTTAELPDTSSLPPIPTVPSNRPPIETAAPIEAMSDTQGSAVPTVETSIQQDETTPKASRDQPQAEQMTISKPDVIVSPDEKEELSRRYGRAQAMFRKYNIDLEEAGWDVRPAPQGERVYKSPRIRVRWTCHECKTTFGHDKICVECAHLRCRNCARYPPKKKKAKAAKMAALAATITEPTTEDIQQGACHECQTTFDMGTQVCSNCHHQICERCLQETLSSIEPTETQAVASA